MIAVVPWLKASGYWVKGMAVRTLKSLEGRRAQGDPLTWVKQCEAGLSFANKSGLGLVAPRAQITCLK